MHEASSESAARAVFLLYRIGSPDALNEAATALSDPRKEVRIAAARAVGMARYTLALDRLMEIVKRDEEPVRRQAAAALGQIGDPRAVGALIAAVLARQMRDFARVTSRGGVRTGR